MLIPRENRHNKELTIKKIKLINLKFSHELKKKDSLRRSFFFAYENRHGGLCELPWRYIFTPGARSDHQAELFVQDPDGDFRGLADDFSVRMDPHGMGGLYGQGGTSSSFDALEGKVAASVDGGEDIGQKAAVLFDDPSVLQSQSHLLHGGCQDLSYGYAQVDQLSKAQDVEDPLQRGSVGTLAAGGVEA